MRRAVRIGCDLRIAVEIGVAILTWEKRQLCCRTQRHGSLRKKNQRRFSLRATRLTDFFAEATAPFAELAAFLAFF
jgi:hypothetical protein